MLIKIVDDDQVFAKKIESMVYDGFKDIFLDYSIDCITSHFEDRYFEKGDIFFLDIDLKEKIISFIAETNIIIALELFSLIFSAILMPFFPLNQYPKRKYLLFQNNDLQNDLLYNLLNNQRRLQVNKKT